jgi:hypothetical protein
MAAEVEAGPRSCSDPLGFDPVWRMLVRATTKNYNKVVAELVRLLRKPERANAGDAVEAHLAAQPSASSYWPDDDDLREEMKSLLAYRRLGRGRLRMVLEAIEDHLRGWKDGKSCSGRRARTPRQAGDRARDAT